MSNGAGFHQRLSSHGVIRVPTALLVQLFYAIADPQGGY
jgi:hypothetical protein